jgi:hypothetical protein
MASTAVHGPLASIPGDLGLVVGEFPRTRVAPFGDEYGDPKDTRMGWVDRYLSMRIIYVVYYTKTKIVGRREVEPLQS